MRRISFFCLLALCGFCLPASGRDTPEQDVEVRVEGSAYMDGLPESIALEEAREAAKRRAVEKGGQTIVQANSAAKNFELVMDVMLTQTQGILKEMRWGKQRTEGRQIFIELTATVKAGGFQDDVAAIEAILRARGLPRVAMVVKEDTGTGIGQGTTAAEIEDYFVQKGLRMMDADAVKNAMAREGEDLFDRPEMAQALAKRLGVDILVLGTVRCKPNPPEDLYGVKMVSHTLEYQFHVVEQHMGAKLAVKRQSFKTRACPEADADKKILAALESCGKNLGPRLLSQMLIYWTKQQRSIELVIGNANQTALAALQMDLRTMGGQQTWVLRSMRGNTAVVDFHSELPIDAVALHLEGQKNVPLKVTDRLESKIVCEVTGMPKLPPGTKLPEGVKLPDGMKLPGGVQLPEGVGAPGTTAAAEAPTPAPAADSGGKSWVERNLFWVVLGAGAAIVGLLVVVGLLVAVLVLKKK